MKRIVIRVAVLGTVVVLGLIAIAHAQRSSREKPAVDAAPASAAQIAGSPAEPSAAGEPGLMPHDNSARPLPPATRDTYSYSSASADAPAVAKAAQDPPQESPHAAKPTDEPPAFPPSLPHTEKTAAKAASAPVDPYQRALARIKQTDAQPTGQGNVAAAMATEDAPPRGNPLRESASDPFGSRRVPEGNPIRSADAIATSDSDAGSPSARIQLTAGEAPRYTPATAAKASQTAPPSSPALVAVGPAVVAPSGSTASAVTDHYAPAAAEKSSPYGPATLGGETAKPAGAARDGQEPAAFRADPLAASSGMRRLPASPDNAMAANPSPSSNDNLFAGDAPASSGDDGSAEPGDKQLEGPQSPQLTIEKSAPPEIQVGKRATLHVTVRNTGHAAAANVEVHDQIPRGTRLLGTTPHAARNARGELVWSLGTLKPGDESAVQMEIMPTAEGVAGSVATVRFDTDASARSTVTRPRLAISTSGREQVLIGEDLKLTVTISNPGSGVATGVVLEEHVPANMQHPAGAELEYPVGDLKPGESRKLDLKLAARRAGPAANVLLAHADGNLKAEDRLNLQVLAPQLDLSLVGPKRRYLEREASYQVSISNPGTAVAQQIDLVAYLPNGLKFVRANNAGQYTESDRAVHWRLQELPNNETGTVELVTLPVEAGQQNLKLRATAQRGLATEKEQPITVEGIAAVLFQVANDKNPVEVGGESTSEIRVVNRGSKAASNVRVAVLVPAEMKALAAEGPTRFAMDGNRVLFEGLATLAPKADAIYRVRLRGLQAGDVRVRCQLMTDEMQSPINKEEGVRVYADQ
jgi:uncharacterized repeat protein (TIGR01451 family)